MSQTSETASRPLASLVLFAYNQEQFIREAVAGAFAQTYQPLEIILSDDGSSDRTFAIIEEMVAQYRGPHQVRAVRNDPNMGLIRHVLKRCREARGEYVVVTAGDDISRPQRVELAVAPMIADKDVYATVSLVDIIDEQGRIVATNALRPLHFDEPDLFVVRSRSKRNVIQGCAAAYRKAVFAIDIDDQRYSFAEDMLFSFHIQTIDRIIEHVDHSLVEYRLHDRALSNNRGFVGNQIAQEEYKVKSARDNLEMYGIFQRLLAESPVRSNFDEQRLHQAMEFERTICQWGAMGTGARLRVFLMRALGKGRVPLKWMLLRLFGSFPRYQPRTFIAALQSRFSGRR